MDITAYIKSGVLEQYCLGMLNADEETAVIKIAAQYPEVKQELAEIERAIEHMAAAESVQPDNDLKEIILASLGFSRPEVLDWNNLPTANMYSNHESWLKVVKHLIPDEPFDDFFIQLIRQEENLSQMLVISKVDVPKETHEEIAESFLILKGECICTVGEETFQLKAGDFLEIPLHKEHDVKVLSPYVIAVLQHQLV